MLRIFRQSQTSEANESLWAFSYVDWQGKVQVGVGTESRAETEQLAERVQQEHHLLRKHRRAKLLDGREALQDNSGPPILPPSSALDIVIVGASHPEAPRNAGAADGAPGNVRIGELLVQAGLIAPEDVEAALRHQETHGGRLIDIIIKRQAMTPEAYLRFMGNQPGTPYIDLENCLHIPAEVIQLVSIRDAERFEIIPIDRIGKMLSVAMICPIDRKTIAQVQRETGLKVRPMLCSHAGFRNALSRHYRRTPQHADARNPV